jgi:hypothetical protein
VSTATHSTFTYSTGWEAAVPEELRKLSQWVVWKFVTREGEPKPTKVPYRATKQGGGLIQAKTTEPASWTTFEKAKAFYQVRQMLPSAENRVDGIGFVFAADDPYVGVDFDAALVGGEIQPWAQAWLDRLGPTYIEISPSGQGFKAIYRGTLPPKGESGGRKKGGYGDGSGAIEIYHQARYFTITGDPLFEEVATISTAPEGELLALVAEVDARKAKARPEPGPSREPGPDSPKSSPFNATATDGEPDPRRLDDDQLLEKARRARKNGDHFSALFDRGDTSRNRHDESSADLALMNMLAFWTNHDAERMRRLFSRSELGQRDKWRERPDYQDRTIEAALRDATAGFGDGTWSTTSGREAPPPPPGGSRQKGRPPILANYTLAEDKEGNPIKVGRTLGDIAASLIGITGGWPKRIGEALFVPSAKQEPLYLNSPSRLFAWIGQTAQVDWAAKSFLCATQEQFYEFLRMNAEGYQSIEVVPHWPPLEDTFYLHREIPRAEGRLESFLDMLCPDTAADRELIKSMVCTLFWGGRPGSRPAFLITSASEDDDEQGRGVGKTTLAECLGETLTGGYVDVAVGDSMADVKTRILSPDGRHKRVVRIDNIKTEKLSWAELESSITASWISGRELYHGEGRRRNSLVWILTVNGGVVSKDIAQRLIPIRLRRPDVYSASWEDDFREFIEKHRWSIMADCRELLQREPGGKLESSRWASWERDILSKLVDPDEIRRTIERRRAEMDGDEDDRDELLAIVEERIEKEKGDARGVCFFIPTQILANWINEVRKKNDAANTISGQLRRLGSKKLTKSKRGRPGFIWRGEDVPLNATADAWVENPYAAKSSPFATTAF